MIFVRSLFSKSSVFKVFFVHTKTQSSVFKFLCFQEHFQKAPFSDNFSGLVWTEGLTGEIKLRFQIPPFSGAFSKSSIFGGQFLRISVDGRPNPRNKAPFSNPPDVVWTGPYFPFFPSRCFLKGIENMYRISIEL